MIHELRQSYHDRIAGVRTKSIGVVDSAVDAVWQGSDMLVGQEASTESLVTATTDAMGRAREVETEVLALLAQHAPVSRDLRMILTVRDVVRCGELCLGLGLTVIRAAPRLNEVLTANTRAAVGELGRQTAELLGQANRAWVLIDATQAEAVLGAAAAPRDLQRRLFCELSGLDDVPTDAAVALGVALRAYERLTDHAVDIARRVIFAATGIASARLTFGV